MSYTVEEKLAGCHKTLLRYSIWNGIGSVLVYGSMAIFGFNPFIILIAAGVIGFPVLKAFFLGGFGAVFAPLKADYEVVTVDGAGNRISSDGGAQSIQTAAIGRLFLIAAVYAIAPTIVLLVIVVQSFRGIGLYLKAKPKPAFIKSPPFLALANVALYIVCLIILFGTVLIAGKAHNDKIANLAGRTLHVNDDTVNLRAEPSGTGRIIKTLNKNDEVTATGNALEFWVPIKSGSDSGFVYISSLGFWNKMYKIVADPLYPNVEFPFLASTASTVTLMSDDNYRNAAFTLKQDSNLTVIRHGRVLDPNTNYYIIYLVVEYENATYRIWGEDREKLDFIRTLSHDTP